MTVQILVTKPGTLDAGAKAELREHGIVCVEADAPNDVRLLEPSAPFESNDLLWAAMQGLVKADDITGNRAFRNCVNKLVEDRYHESRLVRREPTP